MPSSFFDHRTVEFILYDWLGLEALLARPAFSEHSRSTVDSLLELSEKLARRDFLSHSKESDQKEPVLAAEGVKVLPAVRQAIAEYANSGLFAAGFDARFDGASIPFLVESASLSYFMAANIATSAYVMLTVANARVITTFGNPEQIRQFAEPQIAGATMGTMCLSEPDAGSALGNIKTTAHFEVDDASGLGPRYRIVGRKMWISGGDHDVTDNIVHLVLAKTLEPDGTRKAGTRGISLFIVPKFLPDGSGAPTTRNDVVVAGLNHKMGYRGISNCLLNFGEGAFRPEGKAGAVGYLLGKLGEGLPTMFHMMNEARVKVGLGAACLGMRGYVQSLEYAKERLQGRAANAPRGDETQVAIIEHADVKRMLLAQKAYAEGALALVLFSAKLVDDAHSMPEQANRDESSALLDLITPAAKTWPSEWGLAANDLAIQVHGGYGYTRDFDVEQIYRDNRLNPIHEGTTGIQGQDLLGRKILRDKGSSLKLLQSRVQASVDAATRIEGLRAPAGRVAASWAAIAETVDQLLSQAGEPGELDNATAFLSAFGHAVVGWLWLDMALACLAADPVQKSDFHTGKLRACAFFCAAELPKVDVWLASVRSRSAIASGMTPAQF